MYLRIDEGFDTHRKTLALCRVLNAPEGGMFMIRLWRWACRSSPNGDLSGLAPGDIEEIVRWKGAPGAFYAAARGVGFIDDLGDRRELHDWNDWTGSDVEEMAADARRKWWWRRHSASPRKCGGATGQPEPCPLCLREGHQSSGGPSVDGRQTSTVDQTRPDQTRTEQKEEGKRPRGAARHPNLHESLLAGFGVAWTAKYDEPYTPTPADRSQLGRLLRALKSPDECAALPDLFLAYLRDEDPFVADKQRHSLAYFCTSGGLNKYRTKPAAVTRPTGSAQQREDRNHRATSSWLARKGAGDASG